MMRREIESTNGCDKKNRQLKETFKEALIEVFETRRDILVDAVTEAIEEIGMVNAIKEGDKNDLLKEEVVMNYVKKRSGRKTLKTIESRV